MSFLNWIMLGGVAAMSIPLVIHFFNRSRFRVVEWGAMHLLQTVVRVNRKRVRLEQLILLLVRCAIPLVLALLMARPVITGWRALAGDTPASTVILLDNSYSMEAGGATGTNFDAAVEQAARAVDSLKRGSDVSVVLMGGGAEPIFDKPVFDTRGMVDQLRLLRPGYGPADTADAITTGAAIVSKMSHAKRDVLLVSDFQKANWTGVDAAERQRLAELLSQMDVPATLTFMHVGQEVTENIAIESLDFSRSVAGGGAGGGASVGVGQTLGVRANLRNYGTKSYQNLRVYCRVDGKEHGASQVALAGGETAQVLFNIKFDTGGSHVVEIEADAPAPDLKADNIYMAAVPVLETIPVLLVNGDPSRQPLAGETDFLEIALQPYATAAPRGDAKLADIVKTETIEPSKLNAAVLAGRRVVVLANVPKLSDEQAANLRGFVERGDGLLVFPGSRIDLNWYNSKLLGDGILPARYESLSEQPASIVAQRYDHPALALFNDRANGNLSEAEIRTWYKLTAPTSGAGARGGVTVLARLDTGDPLMIEHRVGEGAVIQVATAADADWSNLPMRPFYLPMMQQVVMYLATNIDPPRNVEVGKPIVAFLPRETTMPVTLTTPDGAKIALRPVEKNGRAIIEYANTRRPGLYTLNLPGGGEVMHFVVTAPRTESQLEQLSQDELQQIAASMNASVARTAEEYAALDAERRHGREIWKVLLLALLGLVFAELLLESAFGGAAKGGAP